MTTTTHTAAEIQQLKNNCEYVLEHIDEASLNSNVNAIGILLSMGFVWFAAVTNSLIAFSIYFTLVAIAAVVISRMWTELMNVYTIHTNESLQKLKDSSITYTYASMLKSYKGIGLIAFTTILECYFLIAYADAVGIAILWAIVCLIPSIVAVRLNKTYENIKKVHEYAVQNS